MSLREKVLRQGAYLIIRQGLGLLIGVGGVFLLTRLIGPANYGLYASVLGILMFISSIAGLGVNVYLIRQNREPTQQIYNQAFTLLLLSNLLLLSSSILLAPFLSLWLRNSNFVVPFITLVFTLPLNSVIFPSMAILERNLDYKKVAIIELIGQIFYYVTALLMAYMGYGVWAAVIGYLFQQLIIASFARYFSNFSPKINWNWKAVKQMVSYGIGYSSSLWIWQLRSLVNPLIVGRFLGQEAVGHIALAIRLVEALSFVKGATWRVAISALAKLQGDYNRLKRAMEEGMVIQVLSLGPFLAVFALISKWVIPFIFGEEWIVVLEIFPFIALSYLVNSIFNMHSSILYVLRKNWDVTLFHLGHIFLFASGAVIFVPKFGIMGYGLAEVIAILSYIIIHSRLGKHIVASYKMVIPWMFAFIPILFISLFRFPLAIIMVLPLIGVLIKPGTVDQLLEYIKYFRRRIA